MSVPKFEKKENLCPICKRPIDVEDWVIKGVHQECLPKVKEVSVEQFKLPDGPCPI